MYKINDVVSPYFKSEPWKYGIIIRISEWGPYPYTVEKIGKYNNKKIMIYESAELLKVNLTESEKVALLL